MFLKTLGIQSSSMTMMTKQLFRSNYSTPFKASSWNSSSPNSSIARSYKTLNVKKVAPYVSHVEFNRPDKLNSMNNTFFGELELCFNELKNDKGCRAIIFSGNGKVFTSGLDLKELKDFVGLVTSDEDVARKCTDIYHVIRNYQNSITSLEKCKKPVICAVHSACVGGGVDLIATADIRYCTADSWYQVKEVDIGMAADIGTLQRLPKVIGNQGLVRELCFSARKMYADEALNCGLVSRVFSDKDSMIESAVDLASRIAEKSPVAVQGTKVNLNYARDHGVDESLEFEAIWNMTMLQSEDVVKSAMAQMAKQKASFSDY